MSIRKKGPELTLIIPTLNEENNILDCLKSLSRQRKSNFEIIIVDDGSSDGTIREIKEFVNTTKQRKILLLRQRHKGPGEARNLGASKAAGKILVFVDADMTFADDFIEKLTEPILKRHVIGTDSQDELLANPGNFWAKCWNIGRFAAAGVINSNVLKMIVPQKRSFGTIFRAIERQEFEKVGGFECGGDYTDDESLAKKLGKTAQIVQGAKFWHRNPDSPLEVIQRTWWIGSGKNFTGTTRRKLINLFKFSPPIALIKGLWIGIVYRFPQFIAFKILYDTVVWAAVMASFKN